jgi:hypothetical protein
MVTQLKNQKVDLNFLLQEGWADHYLFLNCATYKNYHKYSN